MQQNATAGQASGVTRTRIVGSDARMGLFDLLSGMTARLASTMRLDELGDIAFREVTTLGFRGIWMAVFDEQTATVTTLRRVVAGDEVLCTTPTLSVTDTRLPLARGFRERRMINIPDPDALAILDGNEDVPPDQLGLPRGVLESLRGRPFACGPLFGCHGQPVGAIGLSQDRDQGPIPDHLLTTGALPVFLEHVGLAMERARHVEHIAARLVEAQAQLVSEPRTTVIGEAASWVAHDVRNLVNVALFEADVGMRSPASALERLPRIQLINRTIGDLVARMQRIARASEGDGGTADLRQIVDDVLTMLRPMLHQRSIAIDAELPAVPPVRCDRVLAHQIVLNLLVNAQDALLEVSEERRRLAVELHDDGGTVRLTVADSGPGIAPGVLPRLFENGVTTKRDGHLGLGLAAVHAALHPFGGRIVAGNAPGGGARFDVTLPAMAGAAPDPSPPPPTGHHHPARILAIDDDPDVVCIIREYLEPLGHAVATATGSAEAVAMATAEPFDLVLCDLAMPKQNGIDVCRSLRDVGYRGRLVLMTGWENYDLSDEQRGVACDLLLKKPFLGADLIGAIDALLGDTDTAPDHHAIPG